MSPIALVPLPDLSLSSRNARKTGGSDIADLAANIAASGLLQNLIVAPCAAGGFEVIAGGRRLAALQLLAKEGRLPPDILSDGVPCRRIDEEGAIIEASTAENTIRAPLHPADQFAAFQAMVDGGKTVADVAAHFGTSELTVQRRLRLANVAPDLIEEYRGGRATLDQITALALTEDHDAQRRAWAAGHIQSWKRNPSELRVALTDKEISSRDYRVRFVGLDAYESAGGAVRRDLFDDTGGGYIADVALLDRLVEEKIDAARGELEAEGWSFVRVDADDKAWSFRNGCGESEPKRAPRPLATDETQRLEQLRTRDTELVAQIDAAEEADEYLEEEDPIVLELDQVRAEINALTQPVETFTDRQKSKSGCQIVLDRSSGRLEIHRGLIPSTGKAQHQAAVATAEAGGKPAPAKVPDLSESMLRRLTAHKTIALQAGLVANADVALAALAHALLAGIWFQQHHGAGYSALHISATERFDSLDRLTFNDVSNSPHYVHTRGALAQLRATLKVPERAEALLPWLLTQSRDVVISLLAAVAAYTVDAVVGHSDRHPSDKLVEALDLDMADYWTPTAEAYFSQVPRSLGVATVKEALSKSEPAAAAQIETAKAGKAEFAGHCEQLLQHRGWLPKPLRRPGYRLRTDKVEPEPESSERKAVPAMKSGTSKKPTKAAPRRAPAKVVKKTAKKKPAKKSPTKKPLTKKATRK